MYTFIKDNEGVSKSNAGSSLTAKDLIKEALKLFSNEHKSQGLKFFFQYDCLPSQS